MIYFTRFIVPAALLLLPAPVCGQYNVFFQAFDYENQHNGAWAITEHDSSFIVSGIVYGPNIDALQFIAVNGFNGDSLWQNVTSVSSKGQDGYALSMHGSNVYVVGSFHDTVEGASDIFSLKMDPINGDIKYFIPIDLGFNDKGFNLTTNASNLYISGTVYDTVGGITNENIILLMVDTFGTLIWFKEHDYSPYEYPKSLDTTPDGGFLIGGEWINPATQNWDLFLLKLDSAGNTQWHKSYGKTNKERYGYATTTQDGGYAIAGFRETNGQPDGLLIKTDSNGVFQWEKLYGKPQQIDLFKILRQDAKGNFILAGNSRDPNAPNTPRAWLMKTNSNGDTLWTRLYSYYGGDSHTYVEDMIQTSDGGYALTGYTIANVPTGNDLWVLKTDSLGRTCDSPPCHGVITGVNKTELLNSSTLSVYPNPTSGIVIVKLLTTTSAAGTLTLCDAQGRIKELHHISRGASQLSLHIDQPPGIYLLKMETDDGRISTTKLIIAE